MKLRAGADRGHCERTVYLEGTGGALEAAAATAPLAQDTASHAIRSAAQSSD
jgi:hypothetical protein